MKKILTTVLFVLAYIFPPIGLGLRKLCGDRSDHAGLIVGSSLANLSFLVGGFSMLSAVALYSEKARDLTRRLVKFVVPLGISNLLTGLTAAVLAD